MSAAKPTGFAHSKRVYEIQASQVEGRGIDAETSGLELLILDVMFTIARVGVLGQVGKRLGVRSFGGHYPSDLRLEELVPFVLGQKARRKRGGLVGLHQADPIAVPETRQPEVQHATPTSQTRSSDRFAR